MKVVINTCYGGFGLSPEALKRLAEMDSDLLKWVPIENNVLFEGEKKDGIWFRRGDSFLRDSAIFSSWDVYIKGSMYGYIPPLMEDKILRSHPDLVKVVEELGPLANNDLALLKIVDIPDGTDYEIDNYDGIETIHEAHRMWD